MKKLLVIALAIGALSSCKKSDDGAAQLEVTAANMVGVYKITGDVEVANGVTYDRYNGGSISGVAYAGYDACEKDDTFTFTATTVTNSEGAISCSPATTTATVPYTVTTSTKAISIPFVISGTVKSLTAASLVIESTSTSGSITTVKTVTLTK